MASRFYNSIFKIGNKYAEIIQDPANRGRSTLAWLSPEDVKNRQLDVSKIQTINPASLQFSQKPYGQVISQLGDTGEVVVPAGTTAENLASAPLPQSNEYGKYLAQQTPKTQTFGAVDSGATQPNLYKVQTGGIGPDGKPIFDVFSGTEHISSPTDPRLKGVNIANLPTGTAPAGFVSQFTTPGSSTSPGAVSGATGGSGGGTTYNPSLSKLGIDETMWNSLDPAAKAFVESAGKLLQAQFDQGQANVSINADLYNKALASAQTDPDIQAKYGDALKLAQADLTRNLAFTNAEYAQQQGLLNTQQEQERRQQAEAFAAQGAAYSGWRNLAAEQLKNQQSGIIESSRRALQRQLEATGSGLEQRYGTAGLAQFGPITAGGLSYQPVGGVTGTEALAKKEDILSKAQQTFNLEKL